MGYIKTFTIDELRRVVLPKVFVERYGWQAGDKVDQWDMGGAILIKPHRQSKNAKCAICGVSDQKVIINYADICGVCMHEIDLGYNTQSN